MSYNIKNLNNNNIIFYFLLILIILAGGNLFNRIFNNNKESMFGGIVGSDDDDDDNGKKQKKKIEQVNCNDTYPNDPPYSHNRSLCTANNFISKSNNKVDNPAQNNEEYNETEITEIENLIKSAHEAHKKLNKYEALKTTKADELLNTIKKRFNRTNTSDQRAAGKKIEELYNKINVGGALGAAGGAWDSAKTGLS